MQKKDYLNEEHFQKTKKKLNIALILVLVIGISIGGLLIFNGVKEPSSNLAKLKTELETKAAELEKKGITPCANYKCGEGYDLYVIEKALDPSFSHCNFTECKNNELTKEYCKEANKNDESTRTAFIIGGSVVIVMTLAISMSMWATINQRKILAFHAQQVMPIAQEGIEEMAPTMGKAAKEVAKGVKEGWKE